MSLSFGSEYKTLKWFSTNFIDFTCVLSDKIRVIICNVQLILV